MGSVSHAPCRVELNGAAVLQRAHKDMAVQIRRTDHVVVVAHVALLRQRCERRREVLKHGRAQVLRDAQEVVLRPGMEGFSGG